MLWFAVWTVLVVGTLVGAFLLLRHVYRSGKALVVELGRASDVLAEVADRAAEVGEALERSGALTTPAPVSLTDVEAARERRAASAVATERRRDARTARHERAFRRWLALSR